MAKLKPVKHTINLSDFARSEFMKSDEMTPVEKLIYIKLIGLSCDAGAPKIMPANEEFPSDRRTVSRALAKFVKLRLINISWMSSATRVIEVL